MRLRYLLLLASLAFAAYDYLHIQLPQLTQLSSQSRQLERQVAALKQQQAELQARIRQLQDDAFIARYASEHFNLVLPGQVAFTVSQQPVSGSAR